MKKDQPHGKNIKLAAFFILGVILIVALSFIWKLIALFGQSRFDSEHQFILAVENSPVKIFCFVPENHAVNIVNLSRRLDKVSIGRHLEIPVDAEITTTKSGNISQILAGSIFHFQNDGDINIIDKIKLWWFAQSVSSDNIIEKNIDIPVTEDVFSNVIPKLFTDKSVYQEAKTIEVVNATGVSGFGARLTRLLSNIGGNVIMVETGMNTQEKSSIEYSGEFSYTEKRIEKILQITPSFSGKKHVIADIIITIGKDKTDTADF